MKQVFFLILLTFNFAYAQVQLPELFSDSMILQRNQPIRIWGWAKPKEKITVSFISQSRTTRADASGNWSVLLNPVEAGGPYTLSVKASNHLTISNILVGEVWLASGQSNMEMPVKDCANGKDEIQSAHYPAIRQFEVPRTMSDTPLHKIRGKAHWQAALPGNVDHFSATAFYFARKLHQDLGVPVGIIHASWGGTIAETWISSNGFLNSEFSDEIRALPAFNADSMRAVKRKYFSDKIIAVQGKEVNEKDTSIFKNIEFDDENWPRMTLPSVWENRQLTHFDGIVWFRRSVEIDAVDAGKPAILSLATVYDADKTWINGQLVGKVQKRGARMYTIPAGILKAGQNIIAIRIENHWAEGGITGDSDALYLQVEEGAQYRLNGEWAFQVESVSPHMLNISPNIYPSLLYNAMIHPLTAYSIRGVIWYQGESNAHWANAYRKILPLLIRDWRTQFNQDDLPFYLVQLTSYNAANGNDSNTGSSWAELREAQQEALSLPYTGMAVTLDIGDANDIHPLNKQDVGWRLALQALHQTYRKNIVCSGPTYHSMRREGHQLVIQFNNISGGLKVKNDRYGYLRGFEIAGTDQKFYFATATIRGSEVIVSSPHVPEPVAVRYAWFDDTDEVNLFNQDDLPAAPFRTDNWKGITENRKYQFLK